MENLFVTMSAHMIESRSAEETIRLGAQWGREARPGWVIGLTGDLGAGKTQLVKGIAEGLGISKRIQSPTFTLVRTYTSGRLPLYHLDLYRLDSPSQVTGAGLEQYLYAGDGVTVIEWVERWFSGNPLVQPGLFYRNVQIEWVNETERRIRYEDFGS